MLGSLARLGNLVRMSAILHERGKSIPAISERVFEIFIIHNGVEILILASLSLCCTYFLTIKVWP